MNKWQIKSLAVNKPDEVTVNYPYTYSKTFFNSFIIVIEQKTSKSNATTNPIIKKLRG